MYYVYVVILNFLKRRNDYATFVLFFIDKKRKKNQKKIYFLNGNNKGKQEIIYI